MNELTETEKTNIEMFSVLVDRFQMMQGDVSGNREVQALYEQISKLQMKVALNLEEAARKQRKRSNMFVFSLVVFKDNSRERD